MARVLKAVMRNAAPWLGKVLPALLLLTLPAAALPADNHGGIDRSAILPAVSACDDFYRHACGGFIAATPVNAAMPKVEMTDRRFQSNLSAAMDRFFTDGKSSDDPEFKRLSVFYGSCISSLEGGASLQADIALVKSWLGRIDAATDPLTLRRLIGELAVYGVDVFFTYEGVPDPQDLTQNRGEIDRAHMWAQADSVQRAFEGAGIAAKQAGADAQAVASMVAALLPHSKPEGDGEHPLLPAQIEELAPGFAWRDYFQLVGAPANRAINVTSPDYLKAVEQLLTQRSNHDLRAYVRWIFLLSLRGELPGSYSQAFTHDDGVPPYLHVPIGEANNRTRCQEATVRALGVDFSRQFARRVLGTQARADGQRIAAEIREAYVRSIGTRSWLSPAGREATAAKMTRIDLKIGFPDTWPAVGDFAAHPQEFLANALAARRFEQAREWQRAQRPRSRLDWEMAVYPWVGDGMAAARLVIPNGFVDQYSNSIIMTAAFLLPPHFDPNQPVEVNYATFGYSFAHELAHVASNHEFDDGGRERDIWSKADIAAAQKQQACVVQQASSYRPLPDLEVDGEKQANENLADYGGLRLAYEALAERLDEPDSEGMTPAKRFFYAAAQRYCTAQTEQSLRAGVKFDGHGPAAFRINAPLSNMPAFARTFGCGAESRMVRKPSERCEVW